MSLCQDLDFLIYRQRLVLYSQDSTSQKFVSLPRFDDYSYISISAGLADVDSSLFKDKNRRMDSISSDPFSYPSSPLVASDSRRFAGTFKIPQNSFENTRNFISEPAISNRKKSNSLIIETSVNISQGALDQKSSQENNPLNSGRRFSSPNVVTKKRNSTDSSADSPIIDNYFGKSASVYVNYPSIGPILKKELSDVKELDEELVEDDEIIDENSLYIGAVDDDEKSNSSVENNQENSKSLDNSVLMTFPKCPIPSLLNNSNANKRVSALKIDRISKPVSALTAMVVETNDSSNPFSRDFSFFVS